MNRDGDTGRWPDTISSESLVLLAVLALFVAVLLGVAADLAAA